MEHILKYFTEDQYQQLIANGNDSNVDKDHPPIAKLYMTNTRCFWLISEIDPEYPDIAFGLCDLGMGFPEIGSVSLSEIEEAQCDLWQLKRDLTFKGSHPLSVYAKAARWAGEIVTDEVSLQFAMQQLTP